MVIIYFMLSLDTTKSFSIVKLFWQHTCLKSKFLSNSEKYCISRYVNILGTHCDSFGMVRFLFEKIMALYCSYEWGGGWKKNWSRHASMITFRATSILQYQPTTNLWHYLSHVALILILFHTIQRSAWHSPIENLSAAIENAWAVRGTPPW